MDFVRAITASVQPTSGVFQEQAARLQASRLQQTPQANVSIAPQQQATARELPSILYMAAAPAFLTMKLADFAAQLFPSEQARAPMVATHLNYVA